MGKDLRILSEYPLDHVTVHVRTMKEQYADGEHPEAFLRAVRSGLPPPGLQRGPADAGGCFSLLDRCPETEAVMIGRGLLADPALARRLRGGLPPASGELTEWYTRLYREWEGRYLPVQALGRIKKLMEWPAGGDIRKKRMLRKAQGIEECIQAVLQDAE